MSVSWAAKAEAGRELDVIKRWPTVNVLGHRRNLFGRCVKLGLTTKEQQQVLHDNAVNLRGLEP
jgi:hypothetical protein